MEYATLEIEVDETWNGREPAAQLVARLALEKARAGKRLAPLPIPVLAADTEVVLDGGILGKPRDREDALGMLLALSGRDHLVYSAVAVALDTEDHRLSVSRVSFKALSREACERYCDSGEPYGKAGAYAIQGRAAAFVARFEGSYSGVVGLPLNETVELLARHGISTARTIPRRPPAV